METTTKVFNVKENSLFEFATKYLVLNEYDQGQMRQDRFNPYSILKDLIFIRKEAFLGDVDTLELELSDVSNGSRSTLTNVYTYSVQPYDNISCKLELVNFKVNQTDKWTNTNT